MAKTDSYGPALRAYFEAQQKAHALLHDEGAAGIAARAEAKAAAHKVKSISTGRMKALGHRMLREIDSIIEKVHSQRALPQEVPDFLIRLESAGANGQSALTHISEFHARVDAVINGKNIDHLPTGHTPEEIAAWEKLGSESPKPTPITTPAAAAEALASAESKTKPKNITGWVVAGVAAVVIGAWALMAAQPKPEHDNAQGRM